VVSGVTVTVTPGDRVAAAEGTTALVSVLVAATEAVVAPLAVDPTGPPVSEAAAEAPEPSAVDVGVLARTARGKTVASTIGAMTASARRPAMNRLRACAAWRVFEKVVILRFIQASSGG
jgi:hypothetical protein